MKNKSFILRVILITIVFFFNHIMNAYSKEIKLKASEISTLEEGNIIIGKKKAQAKIESELEIYADKFIYNKKKGTLIAEGNVLAVDLLKDIKINSSKINFNKIENQIFSKGKTFFNIRNEYNVESEDVNYLINESNIFSKKSTKLKDNLDNNIKLSSFHYNDITKILRGKNIELIDSDKNKYLLDNGMLKLDQYTLLGKDIKIFLDNKSLINPENEPKLKGNSIIYKNDQTLVKKGIFTACKENDNCPPWSITSKEIIHDKKKNKSIIKMHG